MDAAPAQASELAAEEPGACVSKRISMPKETLE
jgi:hypothetical protein